MKKIIAGLLAIASVLSVSVSAQAAADVKTVTKPGELQFDVSVTKPKVVLDLVMPSKMQAAMNPYGADMQVDKLGTVESDNGVVSVAYPIESYSEDYGIFIDAVAVTTTTGNWDVTTEALTPGVKGANLAVTVGTTEGDTITYSNVAKAATSATNQGNMPLDSTVPADKAKGTEKGETRQAKLAYIPPSADGETASKIFIGFAGQLAEDSNTKIVDWTDSDAINVQLILKVNPGPKTL